MPNAQFTPGPILHYVVLPIAGKTTTAYYLGTHVTAPKQRGEFYEIPVYNDLGGRSAAFQAVADGEEWMISTTLNRFDYNVVRNIRYLKSGAALTGNMPSTGSTFPGTAIAPLGSSFSGGRGTMVIGLQDFQLLLVNSYAFGSNFSGQPLAVTKLDLNNVRMFGSCSLQAYEEDTEGTRVLEVSMSLKCRGVFNPNVSPGPAGNLPSIPPRGFGVYTEGAVPSTLTLLATN